jgi:hypothetical protein
MGRAGVIDNHSSVHLTQHPDPRQYDNLSRDLWWAACKLP